MNIGRTEKMVHDMMSNSGKTGEEKLLDAIFDFGTYSMEEIIHFKRMFDPFDQHTQIIVGRPDARQRERVLDIFYDKELRQYITILTNHNKLRAK